MSFKVVPCSVLVVVVRDPLAWLVVVPELWEAETMGVEPLGVEPSRAEVDAAGTGEGAAGADPGADTPPFRFSIGAVGAA